MTVHFRADPRASASLAAMSANLTPPLRSQGARLSEIELATDGTAVIEGAFRPAVFVQLAASLEDEEIRLSVDVSGVTKTITFASYTEVGAMLPVAVLPIDPTTQRSATTSATVSMIAQPSPNAADVSRSVKLVVAEGNLGRLLFVQSVEKQRLRRELRKLRAYRQAALATGVALDRLGDDVALPRFSAALAHDAPSGSLKEVPYVSSAESDDDYRARVLLWRRFMAPTPRGLDELLNGGPTQPSAMRDVGYAGRFVVDEGDAVRPVAVRLITIGDTLADDVLPKLSDAYMARPGELVPTSIATDQGDHARRQVLWNALAQHYDWPGGARVNEDLGEALVMAAKARAELTGADPQLVLKAGADEPGYELGLEIDLVPLSAGDLVALAAAIADSGRAPLSDPQLEARVAAIEPPADPAQGGTGAWFLSAFGIASAVMLEPGRLAVSTLPTWGMRIDGIGHIELLSSGEASYELQLSHAVEGAYPRASRHISLHPFMGAEAMLRMRGLVKATPPRSFAFDVAAQRRGAALLVATLVDRTGTGPYAYRVSLEPGAPALSLMQYEFVMNLLERSRPYGMRVDTSRLRERIDLNGDGAADALTSRLSQSFRSYGWSRQAAAHRFRKE